MRLGEFCTLLRREDNRFCDGFDGAGVVGVAGTDGQSSDRLSSHGWLLIVMI